MSASPVIAERVRFAPVAGASRLFTPAFMDYLARLHDRFDTRIDVLRDRRAAMLRRPGIEISGPCSITSMFINALNPRARGRAGRG